MTEMSITLTSSYNMALVSLSYVIAVLASYTALDLAGQVSSSEGESRKVWLLGGAIAMGGGIWSMHFIAALAFMLPMHVSYDVVFTLISILPAIVASWIALVIVSRPSMGVPQLIVGGLLMGPGIAAMHYTGISAMRMDATIWYDPLLFALSVVVAIVVSIVALWLAFHLRREFGGFGVLQKVVSALVMGVAVVGMHFTGQAATNFTPLDPAAVSSTPVAAAGITWMAVAIGVTTGLILVLVLVKSFSVRRRSFATARQAGTLS
jgi:methyl-accepting chemotaxis protein PixJ